MLLEVSELFEEVIEEQLKMAVREVPPMFRRWFSDGQQAENMLRYMKWDDGIMGQCLIFMFRIICLKGCFIFKHGNGIMGWNGNHGMMILRWCFLGLKPPSDVSRDFLQHPLRAQGLRWGGIAGLAESQWTDQSCPEMTQAWRPPKSRKDQTCLFGSIMFHWSMQNKNCGHC